MSVRWYRRCLRLLPRSFRQEAGAEMEAVFRDASRSARRRGLRAYALFAISLLVDLCITVIGEWWRVLTGGTLRCGGRSAESLTAYTPHGPSQRGERLMDTFVQNLRYAMRTLRRNPGFTAIAVITLGIGIGANTAVFSIVDAVLLRPLPYAAPDRLVSVKNRWEGETRGMVSPDEFFDYREQVGAFEAVGAYGFGMMNLTGDGEPERVRNGFVTSDVLPLLSEPHVGRVFTAEEQRPFSDLVVLSYGLWQRRFGGSPDVIGRELQADGQTLRVIGVMPAGFRLPEDFATGEMTDLYVPFGIQPRTVPNRDSRFVRAVARLEPGVEPARAAEELRALAASFTDDYPDAYPADMRFSATAVPLGEDVLGPTRPALLVLLGAVGFVLLIACANLSNLLLARVETRQREFAVRAALGAGRGRLARQVLTETVLLGLGGGGLGILVAFWGTRLFIPLAPDDFPRIDAVTVDLRVLAFALGMSLVTALAIGLVALFRVSYDRAYDVLRQEGRGATADRRGGSVRGVLVVVELAFALVLLVGAGLLVRSFARLMAVDPGYRTENILTVDLSLPPAEYESDESVRAFYSNVRRRVAALPGAVESGAVARLPLASEAGDLGFQIEGRPELDDERSPNADGQVITPGYLFALGITLVRGRGITERDDTRSPGVVVINQTMAERYWPGEDPIGQRIRLGPEPGVATIVGIVRDVRQGSLAVESRPEMYLPHQQFHFVGGDGSAERDMTVVLRTAGEPAPLTSAVRREISTLDPNLPLGEFRTMEQVVETSTARSRLLTWLVAVFSTLALLLAAVGIYGLISYTVGQRTREIGIRIALGARPRDGARLVIRQSIRIVALGIGIGIACAFALTRFLESLLYEVSPTDPSTIAGVSAALLAVALLAAWLPARRAARTDPIHALRAE
ncbi:MAG: FtsX-like permease family protein [Gemmatimonas sp.]|nr:FtsX-like permease family protein [Gemmatimonas sp.]